MKAGGLMPVTGGNVLLKTGPIH